MPQTLAQSVRAKYPGVYDDLTDSDLETKIKTKYPGAYDDLPTTQASKADDTPGFVSRATDSAMSIGKGVVELGKVAASGIPGVSGLFPSTAVAAQNMQQGLVDVGKEALSGHPLKAGARLAGINPENLYADYKSGNVPAMLGDVVVPAALAAGPKMFREVGPEVDAALARVKAARAVKSTADANEAYFTNLGKAIGPTAKSPSKDVMNKTAAKPYLAAEHASTPIESVPHVVESADKAIGTIQGKVESYIAPFKDQPIATDPLKEAKTALESMKGARSSDVPKGLAELDDLGLEKPPTFARAFDLIYRLNAENKAILAKNNYAQATVRAQEPGFVAREAAVAALRDGVYDGLESRGVPGVRQLRRDEGALIAVRDAAQKQVFKGDQPIGGAAAMGLPARIASKGLRYGTGAATAAGGYAMGGAVGGIAGVAIGQPLGEILASKLVPRVTRNDLIKGAFKDVSGGKTAYPEPAMTPPVRGLLSAQPTALGGSPDTSQVRTVPAVPPDITPLRRLPAHQGGVPLPASSVPLESKIQVSPSRAVVIRDPRTGQLKQVFTSEAASAEHPSEALPPDAHRPLERLFGGSNEGTAGTVSSRGAIAKNGPLEHPTPDPSSQLQLEGRNRPSALEGGVAALPESLRGHFQSLVPFARKAGFRGTVEELAGHYNDRLNEARTIARESSLSSDEVANSHELIKAISDAGGLGIDAEGPHGMSGELEHILESLHKGAKSTAIVKRGPRAGQEQALPPRQSGGISGASKVIVRKGGYSVDRILEHLNQDPRFHFESMADFLQALTDAVFEETQGIGSRPNPSGVRDIMTHVLHVRGGEKWWEAPAGDADFAFGENDAPTKDIK